MPHLVLLRHGESQWNLENRFTGWVDVPLSPKGEEEARAAGAKLAGLTFDHLFTSVLQRAIKTAELACAAGGFADLPTSRDQALNERHYGDLQGLNKAETAQQYGDEQVKIWRRSYDVRPPNGESLADTAARVLPYYEAHILPLLKAGKNILIVAHGNSLRALVMHLDQLSPQEVLELNIPTGAPLYYELDANTNVVARRYL
ncbi:MAG: 2,3-diphosphoglycerate-dependent phosphoglycerate mutase [Chloracidobacterium sp.]|uniref:2,3-bisphosphoglycerate-dependent phosphoglycerate mutase n=1 Tax=Chloracidobacterium validum TaxID=2821543 RepID=A0ABX8B6S5_9BACT|nr:2,3-diphosphoglycerate-dependent phosphoglycerate mutase [Chloracidobacterium validum]QUW02666.1 2,3-diphosphoglycerate-dependent phosphoglycerate mutase [Chloracidobacterium validum]